MMYFEEVFPIRGINVVHSGRRTSLSSLEHQPPKQTGVVFSQPSSCHIACLFVSCLKTKQYISRIMLSYSKSCEHEINCLIFVYPGNSVSTTVNRQWTPPHLCRCPETSAPVWRCPCLLLCVCHPATQHREVCFRSWRVCNNRWPIRSQLLWYHEITANRKCTYIQQMQISGKLLFTANTVDFSTIANGAVFRS